ncbi:MAG: multicopper oxidase domain-containing protein [Deltaproteobacteria bacterium]|nr:multicopper oxidase domain-containing protein [Deltaproteobacteria bacterium]
MHITRNAGGLGGVARAGAIASPFRPVAPLAAAGFAGLLALALTLLPRPSLGAISGVAGPTFSLTARAGYVSTGEGGSIHVWGLANGAGLMQYPGPTLLVSVGDVVTITLDNELPVNVSLVFPGQEGVTALGGVPGALTNEVEPAGAPVTYQFTALRPGTFQYHDGSDPQLGIEMGMVGALIVRPAHAGWAYDHADSAYDREVLFLETEMDPLIHELVETQRIADVDFTKYRPTYWFLNGRTAPDTMVAAGAQWLPAQPYSCMPMIHPGEKLLLRIVPAGRDLHPFHTHGQHMRIIAQDGRLLESAPGSGADRSFLWFTTTVTPGGTDDALFTWTGDRLGWDVYGHQPGDPLAPGELAADHGKPFPVVLPDPKDTEAGPFYPGSPFLGMSGYRQPVFGTTPNPEAGYYFMWHSHKEYEMVNNDVFPGGMMTMLVVEHPDVPIMEM